ncbi:MAG: hypothetical protein ACRDNP_15895 [Gaiellaceae bacterium]
MRNDLATVTERINVLLARIERGDYPDRARLEDTLTEGYAYALSLDAECGRLERRIARHAEELTAASGEDLARDLSDLAGMLSRRRRELDSLRGLLVVLRAGVQEARVA